MNVIKLSENYESSLKSLENMLHINESFDILKKPMTIGEKKACLLMVDGFVKDAVMEKIMEFLLSVKKDDMTELKTPEQFAEKIVSYVEVDLQEYSHNIITAVLSGSVALLIDGYVKAFIIDARTYPGRDVSEPEDDRVLRGGHDGFVETLVFNTALVRRRIRDPELTMEIMQIGSQSKTDVVICYLKGTAEEKQLTAIKKKLKSITIGALSMGQESLAECLVKKQWFNPFPKIRYTERPDAAAACVLEGKILIITDNSPSVMILPTAFFDFLQDTNDYYFPPLVGTYLRLVRIMIFIVTIFLTPVWFLLIKNPSYIPSWLDFIKIKDPNSVPVIAQLIIIEFVIDGLKLASLNTPSVLSNSFSVVGALILGDFAIKANLFVPEVVLYMAFVAIATFTQPSFELGYAFKLFRMIILVLTAIFNIWGFAAGILLMATVITTTKTVTGRCYLFPFIPFNAKAIKRLFIREPINRDNS